MPMKKLLLILSVFLISFNSYGETGCSGKDYKEDILKSTIYFQERGGLFYLPNQSEPYSGENLCVHKDASGQYYLKGTIKNGKKHGKETWWHENGQKEIEQNYIDGKRDGKSTWWYENGQIKFEGIFKDGELNGKATGWHEDGQIEGEAIFKDSECISGDCD